VALHSAFRHKGRLARATARSSRLADGQPTVALTLSGTVTFSVKPPAAGRFQVRSARSPALGAQVPWAIGETDCAGRRNENRGRPGAVTCKPNNDSTMSDEWPAQPAVDSLFPFAGRGSHIPRLKVPPLKRILAHPSQVLFVQARYHLVSHASIGAEWPAADNARSSDLLHAEASHVKALF